MRPRVICHMATSIDGRIVTNRWPDNASVRREYEQIHNSYEADAWMCGRITMEPFAGAARSDADVKHEYTGLPREDHIAPGTHESFAVAIDPSGRLAWDKNDIDGDHVIAVLSGRVSNEYLAFLRDRGVSYVIAGKRDIDLAVALEPNSSAGILLYENTWAKRFRDAVAGSGGELVARIPIPPEAMAEVIAANAAG